MIVSALFLDQAVANNVITPAEKHFIIKYNAQDAGKEETSVMRTITERLVLWVAPTYNEEAV